MHASFALTSNKTLFKYEYKTHFFFKSDSNTTSILHEINAWNKKGAGERCFLSSDFLKVLIDARSTTIKWYQKICFQ